MDESEILRFEQQQQITKLSQAIREGAKRRPQCTGKLFRDGASCVWGAAFEGAGGQYLEGAGFEFLSDAQFPFRFNEIDDEYRRRYGKWMWQHNDSFGMSREAIADKLEALGY